MDIYWLGNSTFKLKGKLAAAIVNQDGVAIDPHVFSGPGEYESKGIMVYGIANESEGLVYQVTIDGLQVVYLTGPVKLEGIEQIDILLTSTAGAVADLEPKMIIPYGEGENLTKLIKELGGEGVEVLPKLSITKDKLPDEPQVVVLNNNASNI